jgi:hypothetical protein
MAPGIQSSRFNHFRLDINGVNQARCELSCRYREGSIAAPYVQDIFMFQVKAEPLKCLYGIEEGLPHIFGEATQGRRRRYLS